MITSSGDLAFGGFVFVEAIVHEVGPAGLSCSSSLPANDTVTCVFGIIH